MMELNQKLTKAFPNLEDARYEAFTQGKNTYVRNWGLREGVCSKGHTFGSLQYR